MVQFGHEKIGLRAWSGELNKYSPVNNLKFTKADRERRWGLLGTIEKEGEFKRSWERNKKRGVHNNGGRTRTTVDEKTKKFLVEGISEAILITVIFMYKCMEYAAVKYNPSPLEPAS